MAEIDWQANERIGEIVWWEVPVGVHATHGAALGPWGAIIVEIPTRPGELLVSVGHRDSSVEGVWTPKASLEEAKAWAENTMRARLAKTNEQLDELAALDQDMGFI